MKYIAITRYLNTLDNKIWGWY